MKRGIKNICLGLLGFSAAPILTACYGMPYEEYNPYFDSVEGYVTDTQMQPINNIKVSCQAKSALTDKDGHFCIELDRLITNVELTATDIDGPENGGEYAGRTERVSASNYNNVGVVMEKSE